MTSATRADTAPVHGGIPFIAGKWESSRGGETVEIRNPANGAALATVQLASEVDVDRAVDAARDIFEARTWVDTAPGDRAAVLDRAADYLESQRDRAVDVLTSELGCPRSFADRAHVPNPIRMIRYYAELIRTYPFDEIRGDSTLRSLVTQTPVGVVGAVTPWNGPLSSPVLKVAPALAAGCSVVLKPAPETPLSALMMAEAFEYAGLPAGALSVLPAGREVSEHLVRSPAVDKVGFTGSTAAGKRIMALCAERVARVTLELGGKSAAVILDDSDLDAVVAKVVPMAMIVNGQLCISQSRILAPRNRYKEIVDRLAAAVTALRVGDPFDTDTDIGPLVSAAQRDRVEGYLSIGADEGARVIGGGRPTGEDNGYFVNPAVLADVDNGMRVAREEIFGPVIAIIPYDTEADAVRIANDSPYGLSGSVWSADTDRAVSVARRIRTGMVSINGNPQAFGTPFGGFKQSGIGREMGPEGLAAYLEKQSIALGPNM
ncbi:MULTISPECIES: aldehyde dehydrogenase [Rhodococcus]|uniref:aldehyde dehydrogenase n=1 Tax=Rhodococcus globerulus TaxID=33008 RepID=UPI001C59DB5D|nr:aldehyde dehydrogenase [Rhodococcus globerulus]QXV99918.1 aldehyde dehydrogenase [Rhodococcus globerulus]